MVQTASCRKSLCDSRLAVLTCHPEAIQSGTLPHSACGCSWPFLAFKCSGTRSEIFDETCGTVLTQDALEYCARNIFNHYLLAPLPAFRMINSAVLLKPRMGIRSGPGLFVKGMQQYKADVLSVNSFQMILYDYCAPMLQDPKDKPEGPTANLPH